MVLVAVTSLGLFTAKYLLDHGYKIRVATDALGTPLHEIVPSINL